MANPEAVKPQAEDISIKMTAIDKRMAERIMGIRNGGNLCIQPWLSRAARYESVYLTGLARWTPADLSV